MTLQTLIEAATAGVVVALGSSLVWFLVQPWIDPTLSARSRSWVVAGTIAAALAFALVRTVVRRPDRLRSALEVDRRFALRERVTTVACLSEEEVRSSVGQALLGDATAKVEGIVVSSAFPVRPRRIALLIPVLAGLLVASSLWYLPEAIASAKHTTVAELEKEKLVLKDKDADKLAKKEQPPIQPPKARENMSPELKDLEAELAKLYADTNKPRPEDEPKEKIREAIDRVAAAEDKLKKFEDDRAEKFQKLQEQMQKISTGKNDERAEGDTTKGLEKALSKTDLNEAKKAIDELKKKVKDDKLSDEDRKKLANDLRELGEQLEKLSRNDTQQTKLKELIEKAKREGRDAESLERELKNLEKEVEKAKDLKELAKKMGQCQKCLEEKDLEGAQKSLSEMAKQLSDLEGELEDLKDADEQLQNLKDLKKKLCKACQGEGGEPGDKPGDKDWAKGGGVGSGKRDEKEDTVSSREERIRTMFDPKGKKVYAGSVAGPAFTKKSTVELQGEIQQAVQEAPEAAEMQRFGRGEKNTIKEYFERLGGVAPK